MPLDVKFQLRVSAVELEAWKAAAGDAPLAVWMRNVLNAQAEWVDAQTPRVIFAVGDESMLERTKMTIEVDVEEPLVEPPRSDKEKPSGLAAFVKAAITTPEPLTPEKIDEAIEKIMAREEPPRDPDGERASFDADMMAATGSTDTPAVKIVPKPFNPLKDDDIPRHQLLPGCPHAGLHWRIMKGDRCVTCGGYA